MHVERFVKHYVDEYMVSKQWYRGYIHANNILIDRILQLDPFQRH